MSKHIAPPPQPDPEKAFKRLVTVLHTLRKECPWDRKQTMESLRHLTIEEMYELGDAILDGDSEEIKKELGDLMMHLVFYARIAEEQGAFDLSSVLNGVCEKLITRHPHIYGDVDAADAEQVKQNWEQIKLAEGNRSVLEGVPRSLPALVKAYRIQDKVRGVGFDWENVDRVWEKVEEEMQEFREAGGQNTTHIQGSIEENGHQDNSSQMEGSAAEEEFGDLLFSLINYARHLGINPENALERTNKKFISRFEYLEKQAAAEGKSLSEMTLQEMDHYWRQAKIHLK